MAAAIPPGANSITNLPASIVCELLTKYGFIPTSRDLGQNIAQSFAWQEIDPQFRQFQVTCTGFATNEGRVFVNRDILSLISTDLKGKIERQEPIVFECSNESFATVMSFVHTITGSSRPTAEFVLKLLPMLHDCKLPFLSDLCVTCISYSPFTQSEGLIAAFRAESELLLEICLPAYNSRSQLRHMLEKCNGFRQLRETAFGGKALGRMWDMNLSLPEDAAPPPAAGAPLADHPQLDAAKTRFNTLFGEHFPTMLKRFQCLDFEISIGDESVFTSRAILAQSSRFFQQLFFGDFAEKHLERYSIENSTLDEVGTLLVLVLPTPLGMMWRLTPSPCGPDSAKPCRGYLHEYFYGEVFNNDSALFVNVFKLAEYFQITGLVAYLTDVAVCRLPWRQRLQLADLLKSGELMASLLTDDSLKELKREMAASAKVLDEFSGPTKDLIIEFILRATNF